MAPSPVKPFDTSFSASSPADAAAYDVFELADVGLILVDVEGNVLRANRTVAHVLGRSPADLVGLTLSSLDAVLGESLAAVRSPQDAGEEDARTLISWRTQRPDGSVVWLDASIRVVADGSARRFLVQVSDATGRHLAEEDVRRLEAAQRIAHLGSFEQDPDTGVLDATSELKRLLGIESTGPISVSQLMDVVHPDDRARLGEAIGSCLADRTPVDMVHRLVLADGTTRWVHALAEWSEDPRTGRRSVLGTIIDITEREVAEQAVAAMLRELEDIQRLTRLGSFEHDPALDQIKLSNELRRLLGIQTEGTISIARMIEAVHPEDQHRLRTAMEVCVAYHSSFDVVHRLLLPDETLRWVHTQGEWVPAQPGGRDHVLGSVLDITERKIAEDTLVFEFSHDNLTGLTNRAAFLKQVDRALSASQSQARQLAVLLMDVDDFKTVNDSLGHVVGDELLVDLAHRLTAVSRGKDAVARFGGDEFAVLIEANDARNVAQLVAQRIAETLRSPFSLAEHEVKLSASIGIAVSDIVGDAGALLRDADLAMYVAKQHGKGRYEIADAGMQVRALERLNTIADLHHGVAHGEFEVYYQAIVNSETTVIAGTEALVRWNHPERGVVLPESFIELAESSGLIIQIGREVRRDACRQLAAWRREGRVDDNFYVSVNLSPRQLADGAIVENVARDLKDAGLPGSALVLEITESALMENYEAVLARLLELKAMGIRLALDDYGTGYSSLARLSELPIDIIKIDKSFIDHVRTNAETRILVKSVVDVAKALGMATVAEGVEEEDQFETLQKLGFTFIQGFLFAHPEPAAMAGEAITRLRGPRRGHSKRSRQLSTMG